MTHQTGRKELAREIQDVTGVNYREALAMVDERRPPKGWTVNPSRYAVQRACLEVALERFEKSDGRARTVEAFALVAAALEIARSDADLTAFSTLCHAEIEGTDPHTGDWTSGWCPKPRGHDGECGAPDDILYMLWAPTAPEIDVYETFAGVRAVLKDAARTVLELSPPDDPGRVTAIDQELSILGDTSQLVSVVLSYFEEDDVWVQLPEPRTK